jgi:hypothetical protein
VQNDGIDKFNSGLGAVLAVDPLMDGWCSRGPAVDPAYGPRWTGAKGSNPPPDLIWTVGRRSIGWGGQHTRAAAGQRRSARDCGGPPGTRRRLLETELESSVCNAGGLKTKRGRRRTHSGA